METKREHMIVKFNIPSRGIGLRNQLLATAGEAIMAHRFIGYRHKERIAGRNKGSLISMERKTFLILLINYKIVESFLLNKCEGMR
jgi:predicted membrane GTPase involved in stress response